MKRAQGFLLCLALVACSAAVALDAGCTAYGEARLTMPALGTDDLSRWVALLDSRMTAACRE